MTRTALAAAVATVALLAPRQSHAARALGVDVSHFQNVNNWTTVQAAGISFVFMKSSEGVSFTDPVYNFRVNALHTTSTLLFAPYHFAHPDTNSAVAEANYFFQVGGSSMKAGNLLPVLDLEDGKLTTSGAGLGVTALTQWVTDFSNQIYSKAGVRPIVYANGQYVDAVSSSVSNLDLWYANPGFSVSSALNNVNTGTTDYGAWTNATNNKGAPKPWSFWQYNWKGEVAGIDNIPAGAGISANTTSDLDLNVANGDIEFVKQFKIPALWTVDADGTWGETAKWNGYASSLPTATDRVVLDRAAGLYTITVPSSARVGQSLESYEKLAVSGGSLTLGEYARLYADSNFTGGSFTAASVLNNAVLTVAGGAATTAGALSGTGTAKVSSGTLAAASLSQGSLTISGGTTTITGAVTTTGGTSVSAGTLNVGSMPSGTLAVTGTGLAKFTGTGGSKVTSLGVANTADLDVGLTELAVDYTTTSPLASYRTALAAGAIASNKAAAGVTAVGAVESKAKYGPSFTSASWGDGTTVAVDATSVLVALALFGDTNFDRVVNLVDLSNFAAHYMNPAALWNWQDGDFTYDGGVTQADLALLRANYGRTLLADGTYTAANTAQFDLDVTGFASIPEPASLAALALLGVVGRRRRA